MEIARPVTMTFPYLEFGHILGQIEDVTYANGAVTSSIYDVWGRVSKIWRPGEDKGTGHAATEEVRYTDFSGSTAPTLVHTLHREDAGGVSTASYLENWQFYDGLGRVIQTQSEYTGTLRSLVDKSYGPYGSVASTTVPYSASVTGDDYHPPEVQPSTLYDYDALGRSTVVTNPNSTTMRSFYNVLQRATIDEKDHQTIAESDAFGRLIRSNQYEGEYGVPNWTIEPFFSVDYTYDVLDNLRFVHERDKQTEMQYDALGRKTYMNDPNMGEWYYGYDAVGNLTTQTDARACVTTMVYDVLDRLTDKTYAGSGACNTTPSVNYTYDDFDGANQFGKGRRTGMSDGSGTTAWVYDQRGRVKSENKTIGTGQYKTEWSGYDALDRVTQMIYPGSNSGGSGEPVVYTYNDQGLLDSMVGVQSYVESSSYDEAGRLTGRVQRNGDTVWDTTNTFYPWVDNPNLGRLHTINSTVTVTNTNPLQNLTYAYDAVGNVTSIVDGEAVETQDFAYDDLDRLLSVSNAYDETYEYFKGGSIKRKGEPGNANDGLYAYNDSEHIHAVTDYRGNTYGYDANGNMTSRTVDGTSYTLTYDAENRLSSVVGSGSTVTFTYDGDGNRVAKEEGGVMTHYPGRHYESTESSGNTKYFFADGQLVSFERSPEYVDYYGRRYVFRDHLGSTSILVNGKGETLWEDRYLPYGDVRYTFKNATDMPVQTQYRYTSQWFEDGLGATSPVGGLDRGLYFYGARWYDASLGRFLQPDTIVPNPGDPQSLNRYSSVLNNPMRYTDPTGHCIVQYSGDVRMNEAPYGTSGLCVNTKSVIQEGTAARDEMVEELPGPEQFVPDEGTLSLGVSVTGGAGVYGTGSLIILSIDSNGDVQLFSLAGGGGGIAGGTLSIEGFLLYTGALTVDQLEGPAVTITGLSAGEVLVGGYERIVFKDYATGEMYYGNMYMGGIGANVTPLFSAEAHAGATVTKHLLPSFNWYDFVGIPRPINDIRFPY